MIVHGAELDSISEFERLTVQVETSTPGGECRQFKYAADFEVNWGLREAALVGDDCDEPEFLSPDDGDDEFSG